MRTLDLRQVASTRHSSTGGRRVMRARSCSEGRARSQWHGGKCSCQDVHLFLVFFFLKKKNVPMVTGVEGLNSAWLDEASNSAQAGT